MPIINPHPVKLYKNIYRAKGGELVTYQNYHESMEEARATFKTQMNGDKPVYILEVNGLAYDV